MPDIINSFPLLTVPNFNKLCIIVYCNPCLPLLEVTFTNSCNAPVGVGLFNTFSIIVLIFPPSTLEVIFLAKAAFVLSVVLINSDAALWFWFKSVKVSYKLASFNAGSYLFINLCKLLTLILLSKLEVSPANILNKSFCNDSISVALLELIDVLVTGKPAASLKSLKLILPLTFGAKAASNVNSSLAPFGPLCSIFLTTGLWKTSLYLLEYFLAKEPQVSTDLFANPSTFSKSFKAACAKFLYGLALLKFPWKDKSLFISNALLLILFNSPTLNSLFLSNFFK